MKKKQDNGTITSEGYCIDLLNELARVLKFTYEIYYSPDGLFGGVYENGTWNGMIGELVSKVVVPLALVVIYLEAGRFAKNVCVF